MTIFSRLPIARNVLFALAASLLGAAVGCGTAEYESRLDESISRLKLANKFVMLDEVPTLIAKLKNDKGVGTEVSFRKPKQFINAALTEGAADPRTPNQTVNPIRPKPPMLQNYPGFRFAFEQMTVTNNVLYLYVGVQAAVPGTAEKILEDLKAAMPDQPPPTWGNVSVTTPEGTQQPWRKLTITSPQEFAAANNQVAETFQATLTLWYHEEQGVQVLLGTRSKSTLQDSKSLSDDMLAAAGTVVVRPGVKLD